MEYIFESDFFAISDQGIHLLRNRYNYKTLDFKEIEQVILEEGKLVNNWILLFTIGLIAVGFAVFYSFRMFEMFNDPEISHIYLEEIIIPVIPLLVGAYCIYTSLRKGPTLKIVLIKNQRKSIPLDKVEKNDQLSLLTNSIKEISALNKKAIFRI